VTPVTAALLRPAGPADAAGIADLLTQLGYPTEPAEMERRLAHLTARDDYHALAAVADDRIVGFAGAMVGYFFEREGVYGRVLALVVDEAYRRRGIGRTLLVAAEDWLEDRGAVACIINSGSHRPDAHRFYERMGYDATGLRFSKPLEGAAGGR
jgi:GNAT superfamily N-acetyltransferase